MVAFMHTGTRLTAGYRYTTLGDATLTSCTKLSFSWGNANFRVSALGVNLNFFISSATISPKCRFNSSPWERRSDVNSWHIHVEPVMLSVPDVVLQSPKTGNLTKDKKPLNLSKI